METKKFKDLTIRDAFMFAAVMSDPEICRKVLELALGIPISEVHIQTEKTMAYHSEYHGVPKSTQTGGILSELDGTDTQY